MLNGFVWKWEPPQIYWLTITFPIRIGVVKTRRKFGQETTYPPQYLFEPVLLTPQKKVADGF